MFILACKLWLENTRLITFSSTNRFYFLFFLNVSVSVCVQWRTKYMHVGVVAPVKPRCISKAYKKMLVISVAIWLEAFIFIIVWSLLHSYFASWKSSCIFIKSFHVWRHAFKTWPLCMISTFKLASKVLSNGVLKIHA